MLNEKSDNKIFIVSEDAQMFLQTNEAVKQFESVKYKKSRDTVSLVECVKTIAKDKCLRLDLEDGKLVLSDEKRKFIINSFYCPKPSMWDEPISVEIITSDRRFLISYCFVEDEKDLSSALIYEKDENGEYNKLISSVNESQAKGVEEIIEID